MDVDAAPRRSVRRRHLAVDERGIGLRATWHLDRRLVNLSLWRGGTCVETFHLTPGEAGQLVGFLVDGLVEAVPEPGPAPPVVAVAGSNAPTDTLTDLRRRASDAVQRLAARLQP